MFSTSGPSCLDLRPGMSVFGGFHIQPSNESIPVVNTENCIKIHTKSMETSEIQSPPKFFSGYVPQTRDFALHTRGFTPAPIVGFLFGFGGAYFIARCIHLDAGSDVVEVSLAPI